MIRAYSFPFRALLQAGLLLVASAIWLLLSASSVQAITVNLVDGEGFPVATGFRWLLEEDNSNQSTLQMPSATSIGLSIHKSHAPAVAQGVVTGSSTDITLPDATQRYFLSVLPTSGYSMSGAVLKPGDTQATITVHAYNPAVPYNPDFPDVPGIPTAQISVLVFEDNWPINNAPDDSEPGLENFTIIVADAAGLVSQDIFGNPLGTTYQPNAVNPDGTPVIATTGTGIILTDADGKALIKNLAPGKYGLTINPPTIDPITQDPVDWIQTATIEGTPTVDAWVKANEAPTFVEGFGTGFVHAFFGFVRLETLPWAVTPPVAPTTGTITGINRFNHFSRPPLLQGFHPGAPVGECFVGLNDPVSGEGLIAVACDDTSSFSIPGVPPGTYQLVTWDKPLDALFGFHSVTVPATGGTVDLGDVLSFRWFGQFKGTVFNDLDEDGFRDCVTPECNSFADGDEIGILEQNVNIRFRDGTIYQAQPTDVEGGYDLAEVFPFFKWLVVEVDFASFKATGMTTAIDDGGAIPPEDGWTTPSFGILTPQPQVSDNPNTGNNLSRTETGPVLTQAMMLFLGQANVIDWGKTSYGPGENGGVSGVIIYAVTRAEHDPRWAAAEPWEPGIPRVQVNLYRDSNQDDIIDDVNRDGGPTLADVDNYPFGNFPGSEDFDRNGNGLFNAGDAIQITYSDSFDDDAPSGCIQTLPIVAGQQANECFDNFGTWNQVRPGVFDGGYAFDSYFPLGYGIGTEVGRLPTAHYIVEAANPNPNAYILVKEEDKNVDFGDIFVPSPQLEPAFCVGDLHTVPPFLSFQTLDGGYTPLPGLFPGDLIDAPYAGTERPLCDRKTVRVAEGLNTAADFHYTTLVPKAARLVGFANNDLAAEFDPTSPIFGEKSAPSWLPVALRDWKGKEIVRVYMDEYGAYNAVLPSSFSVNLPTPSGVSPNMVQVVLNDPGPIPDPNNPGTMITDPNYDPNYSVTPWTFHFETGRTSYLDTPLVPVAAFVGYPKGALDTQSPDGTPVITQITGRDGVPLACDDGTTLITISSAGSMLVDNPDYNPQDPTSIAQITRDFGFGTTPGTISVDGLDITSLSDLSWGSDTITFTWPAAQSGGVVKVTRDNDLTSPTGVTVNVIDCATATNVLRVDINYPSAYQTIQAAIDAASAGDLVMVAPGLYNENVILYKPLTLQGSGAGSTTINAAPIPTDRVATWHAKLSEVLYGLGVTNGDTNAFVPKENPGIMVIGQHPDLTPDTLALDFALADSRIDGFAMTGSIAGGGIYVNNHALNLEIANNVIQNNQGIHGAGIVIGTPQILNSGNYGISIHDNRIQRNGGVQGAGGINIYPDSDNYVIRDNIITGNLSRYSGAGIAHIGTSNDGLISHNQILFNEVFYGLLQAGGGSGGGIYVAGEIAGGDGAGNITIAENLIQGNLAGAGTGGGVAAFAFNGGADSSTLTMRNNMIVNNAAALGGGGISLQDVVNADIVFNTIAHNDSTSTAALAFPANNLDISTPRAAGLLAFDYSLALQATVGAGYSNPNLDSNIFWGNRSFFNDANLHGGQGGLVPASVHAGSDLLYDVALGQGDPLNNTYTPDPTNYPDFWDLQVITASPATNQLHPVNSVLSNLFSAPDTGPAGEDYTDTETGNLSADPGFLKGYNNIIFSSTVADEGGNAISIRFRPLTVEAGDYHLATACSPARDGGNQAATGAPTLDYDGDDRTSVALAPADIGADEFDSTSQAPDYPALTMLKPLAGELVPANSLYTITWGAQAGSNDFDLGYNLGQGNPFGNLDRNVTERCYQWSVPANIRNSNNARIGLIDNTTGERQFSEPFTIDVIALFAPNGGELLVSGNIYTITWTTQYAPGAVNAALWYQFDGSTTWQVIGTTAASNGRYDWTIPAVTADTQARVALILYDANGRPQLSDYSDATFTIFPGATTAPATAVPTPAIATPTPATATPSPATATPTTQGSVTTTTTLQPLATIVVEEPQQETVPGVSLLIPNGGEYLGANSELPILWSSPPNDLATAAVEINLSLDNGATWSNLTTLEGDPEYFAWTVPTLDQPTDVALLEVIRLDAQGETIDSDRSDAPFAISTEVP